MSGTYTIDLKCQNCKKWHWIKIPLGVSIEQFGEDENKTCGYCGCQVIKVKEIKEKEEKKSKEIVDEDPDNINLT